jgi:tRNA A37 threonylcarbamoyladenosine synthetase subunit TsaC/SUA5/YrdC
VEKAKRYFSGAINIFVDGGELTSKTGSTVVELVEDSLRIIRPGEVAKLELENFLGPERILL